MEHVDADVLALLAMGEQVAGPAEREHLAACAACAAELAEYERAAAIGRSTLDAGELLEPHARVWDRIAAEVAVDAAAERAASVTPIRRRAWVPWVAGLAAAALVVTSLVVWRVLEPAPSTLLASAELEAFPDWPGAAGTAVVEREPDGTRVWFEVDRRRRRFDRD